MFYFLFHISIVILILAHDGGEIELGEILDIAPRDNVEHGIDTEACRYPRTDGELGRGCRETIFLICSQDIVQPTVGHVPEMTETGDVLRHLVFKILVVGVQFRQRVSFGLDNGKESGPSKVVGMEHGNLLLLANLVEDKGDVALEVEGIDGDIVALNQFAHIVVCDIGVVETDVSLGIDAQQALAEALGLVLPHISLGIVLPVEVAQFHPVAIDNGDALEPKAECTLCNDTTDACTPQQDAHALDSLLLLLLEVDAVAAVPFFHHILLVCSILCSVV